MKQHERILFDVEKENRYFELIKGLKHISIYGKGRLEIP